MYNLVRIQNLKAQNYIIYWTWYVELWHKFSLSDKTSMSPYLTRTSNGFFRLKYFEKKGVQESDCSLTLFQGISDSCKWWLCKSISIVKQKYQNHTVDFQWLFIWVANCTNSAWSWNKKKVILFLCLAPTRYIERWINKIGIVCKCLCECMHVCCCLYWCIYIFKQVHAIIFTSVFFFFFFNWH